MTDVAWGGQGVRGQTRTPELPMVKAEMVEAVLHALGRGTAVVAVARQFGLDPKTVRAWRARGGYRPRQPRAVASRLDPYAAWLAARAPEVGFNAAVLHRELRANTAAFAALEDDVAQALGAPITRLRLHDVLLWLTATLRLPAAVALGTATEEWRRSAAGAVSAAATTPDSGR